MAEFVTHGHKEPQVDGPSIRVRRISQGCCGMSYGGEYEARGDVGSYVSVQLPDGHWTSAHWAPEFFTQLSSEDTSV